MFRICNIAKLLMLLLANLRMDFRRHVSIAACRVRDGQRWPATPFPGQSAQLLPHTPRRNILGRSVKFDGQLQNEIKIPSLFKFTL